MSESGRDALGVWVTISDLARLKRVDKAAISRRVARFAAQGLLTTRAGERGTKLVSLAEFDRVAGETTDAVRALNGSGAAAGAPAAAAPGDPVLAREQARRASYDADLKHLDLDERLRKLMPVADVEDAMARCAGAMVRVIDSLPALAEENAAAVAKDGVAGARAFLRENARRLRERLAEKLRALDAESERKAEAGDDNSVSAADA